MALNDMNTTIVFLSEADSFPYAIGENARNLAIINTDTTNDCSFTVSFASGAPSITGTVPPSTTYFGKFERFITVDISGASTFEAEVIR